MSTVAIKKWLFEHVERTIQRHAVVRKWCDLALILVRVPTKGVTGLTLQREELRHRRFKCLLVVACTIQAQVFEGKPQLCRRNSLIFISPPSPSHGLGLRLRAELSRNKMAVRIQPFQPGRGSHTRDQRQKVTLPKGIAAFDLIF